nr:transposase [Nitrosomonas sp. Nm58]
MNAQSTIQLFQQIEAHHPIAAHIYIICDNARYYRSQLVNDYLNDSKIKLIFLLPYAPNLNLIERYWKFFKKKIFYGRYYEIFSFFKSTCEAFFTTLDHYKAELRTLLTDNFQIIGST